VNKYVFYLQLSFVLGFRASDGSPKRCQLHPWSPFTFIG